MSFIVPAHQRPLTVDLSVVEPVTRLVVLDVHERLELASRLVEGELLGEREHEPAALP